jgi:hypothetical protein
VTIDATRLVRAKVHPAEIKKWHGHQRMETTFRYTHVDDGMLKDALERFTASGRRQVVAHPFVSRTRDAISAKFTANSG